MRKVKKENTITQSALVICYFILHVRLSQLSISALPFRECFTRVEVRVKFSFEYPVHLIAERSHDQNTLGVNCNWFKQVHTG